MVQIDKEYFDKLAQAIVDCNKEACVRLVKQGLDRGVDPLEILDKGLGKGIKKVGDDFGAGWCFLPELIGAADAMKEGVAILDEKIKAAGKTRKSLGKIVIGTVKGDIHDIGKSVVAGVLQANGYDVVDLGIDVSEERFVKAVNEYHADCVAMSSLLTLTIQVIGTVIQKLREAGLRDKVKVIVGGAPVTQEFADGIGADAYGRDAAEAVVKMNALLGGR